jgi:hypothetical protein
MSSLTEIFFTLALCVWVATIEARLRLIQEHQEVQEEINDLYAENAATLSKLLEDHWQREVKKGRMLKKPK